jgi:hypothetical protein
MGVPTDPEVRLLAALAWRRIDGTQTWIPQFPLDRAAIVREAISEIVRIEPISSLACSASGIESMYSQMFRVADRFLGEYGAARIERLFGLTGSCAIPENGAR